MTPTERRRTFQDFRIGEITYATDELCGHRKDDWPNPDYLQQMNVARAVERLQELLDAWGYERPRKAA